MSCSLQQVHLVSEIEKREDSVTSCWVEVRDRSKFNEEDTSEKEKKVKFERVFNWEKMTSFFELFGSILDYKWYQRAHAKTGDETVVSQGRKIDENEERGDKKNYVDKQDIWWNERTDQSFNQMISRSGKLRYEVGKNQISKLSSEMNQSQKVGKQKCPVQHRLRWVQFKIFLAFII